MRIALSVTFALALVPFAGCIQGPDPALEAATTDSAFIASLGAVGELPPAVGLNETWSVIPLHLSPEGGITAVRWSVPEGAIVPWGWNEDFDRDDTVLVMEIALLGDLPADAWGLIEFGAGDEGLEPGGGHFGLAMTAIQYSAESTIDVEEPVSRVAFATFGGDIKVGDSLRLLALGKGPVRGDVAIAFRVLDHDPSYSGSDEEPATDAPTFLAARGAVPPLSLPAARTASGLHVSGYIDVLFGGFTPAEPTWGYEMTFGEPEVAWSASHEERAAGGEHSFEGSVTGVLDHGYDLVNSDYYSLSYGYASGTAEVTLHDESQTASMRGADIGLLGIFTPLESPGVGAFGAGDGDGETTATLAVERIFAGGLLAVTALGVIELGATTEELFGEAAAHMLESGSSGELPMRAILGPQGLLLVHADGSLWSYDLPRGARPDAMRLL